MLVDQPSYRREGLGVGEQEVHQGIRMEMPCSVVYLVDMRRVIGHE